MKYITLFDPSLSDNSDNPSSNLGDLIIYESVQKYLGEILPAYELFRISSHTVPGDELLRKGRGGALSFFGGTNALSADLIKYHQWKINIPKPFYWPFTFPVRDMVLMGVGWWQYQEEPTAYTKKFYKKALSSSWMHSVRDSYTKDKLIGMGITNVLNTGCPTMWELSGMDVSGRKNKSANCLFTLTDYNERPESDNEIIHNIAAGYTGNLYFFPQGSRDIVYIKKLDAYQKHASRIIILERTLAEFVNCLKEKDADYIGTRLHAGVKALQLGKNALILSVDNRATEMAKDTGLPVIERADTGKIANWIAGEKLFGSITVPLNEIAQWKNQFMNFKPSS